MDAMIDNKYVVFKREELTAALAKWGVEHLGVREFDRLALPDAVVIRRQDYFAAPALNAYASCIAIAARLVDAEQSERLIAIADYFHQQSELAGDEAHKLPD